MTDEAPATLAPPEPTSRYGIRHDPAVIQAVAEHIERGLTYAQIAAIPGMPSVRSVATIVSEREDLARLRARARVCEAEDRVAEALAIADAPLPTDPKMASAEAQRARNRVDFRKWLAAHLDRETWDDRPATVAVQVTSNVIVALSKLGGATEDEPKDVR